MAIVSNSARTIRNKSFADGLLPQYQETLLAPNINSIQYLAIAGGGAGGVTLGGGGGAGGFIERYLAGLNTNILGNSVYFDGSGDRLTLSASANFEFGTGDFTIECWAYPISFGNGFTLYINYNNGGGGVPRFGFSLNSTGLTVDTTSGLALTFTGSTTVNTNQWYHCAVTRSGSTFRTFINGSLVSTATSSATYTPTGHPVNIGDYPDDFTTGYGYISNLRVVKGTAVYTSTFTPPTAPLTAIANTSLLTCQSPTIVDNSLNALTITVNGGASVVANGPFSPNVTSTANLTLSIIIGAGGAGTGVASSQGANGGNTLIYSPVGLTANVIAVGGGGGGYYSAGVQTNGSNGGSGGGAGAGGSGQSRSGGSGFGYPSPTQQGNPGGANFAQDGNGAAGGGGGAGGAYSPAVPPGAPGVGGAGSTPGVGGQGATGNFSSILGYARTFAAGGGACGATAGGTLLGSGNEGTITSSGSGTPNSSPTPAGSGNSGSGSGGGGGNASPLGNAGSGGSGVVILRYPDTFANATVTGNPNVFYRQRNVIYRFYQSGSITFADVPRYLL